MTRIGPTNASRGASRDDQIAGAALGIARWLCLAATPTFAIMALTSAYGADPMVALCSAGPGPTLGGMAPMYLLMSIFHSAPWLKLLSGRRSRHEPARQ